MKPPIARRRITGARRIPGWRRPRGARLPLRRPLPLLYRQLGKARTAAPNAVRAADGRAVPLAARLEIALQLSLTLNEQHRAFRVASAPYRAAPAMLAEPAPKTRRSHPAGYLARRDLPGDDRLLVNRRGDRPAAVGYGGADLALRLIELRTRLVAGGHGAGERAGAPLGGSRGSRPQERFIGGRSDLPPWASRGAGRSTADGRFRMPPSPVDRDGERPPQPAPAARRSGRA
jgi:hypothetical protein